MHKYDHGNRGRKIIPLNRLAIGENGRVTALTAAGTVRRRMLDLGLITGTAVEALRKSPSGDPTAFHIRGTVIALRAEEASQVLVEVLP